MLLEQYMEWWQKKLWSSFCYKCPTTIGLGSSLQMPTSKQKQYETTESKLQPLQPCAFTTLWLMNDPLHRNNLAFEVVMGHSSARLWTLHNRLWVHNITKWSDIKYGTPFQPNIVCSDVRKYCFWSRNQFHELETNIKYNKKSIKGCLDHQFLRHGPYYKPTLK